MTIVEIQPLSNGAHRNQSGINFVPPGWAKLPEDLNTTNFPYGTITVETIEGIPVVTSWTPIEVPEPIEPEIISTEDILAEIIIDHEYRLALLEEEAAR